MEMVSPEGFAPSPKPSQGSVRSVTLRGHENLDAPAAHKAGTGASGGRLGVAPFCCRLAGGITQPDRLVKWRIARDSHSAHPSRSEPVFETGAANHLPAIHESVFPAGLAPAFVRLENGCLFCSSHGNVKLQVKVQPASDGAAHGIAAVIPGYKAGVGACARHEMADRAGFAPATFPSTGDCSTGLS